MSEHRSESLISVGDIERVLGMDAQGLTQLYCETQIEPQQSDRGLVLSGSQARVLLQRKGYRYPAQTLRVSLMMCKGGVGKTTTCFFLGQRLASYGARVLLIDSDPQGNLTAAMQPGRSGFQISENTPVLLDVLTGVVSLERAILPLNPQLHLLPSTPMNSLLDRRLMAQSSPVLKLDKVLRAVDGLYDFILIDASPTLNLINAAIVYASSIVILPTPLEEFSHLGLEQTIREIRDLQQTYQLQNQVRILLNRYRRREKSALRYLGYLADEHRAAMLSSTIRECRTIREAIARRQDLFLDSGAKAAEDYDSLAREILHLKSARREIHG